MTESEGDRPLIVVSGLPRSGTSMMMKALAAGGLPVVRDEHRPADEHNPGGYFEDQRVAYLASEASWLQQHRGSAVKILSHLLPAIPVDLKAKVLLMRRPLVEVVASQNAMLGCQGGGDWDTLLRRELGRTLTWLQEQTHLEVLELQYTDLVRSPGEPMSQVRDFLERDLDVEAMTAVVDPALHRQRRGYR